MNTRRAGKGRIGTRLMIASAVLALTTALSGGVALAADQQITSEVDGQANPTVSGFKVDPLTAASGTNITLEGASQDAYTNIDPFTVVDATGTGEGWTLTLAATPLTATVNGAARYLDLSFMGFEAGGIVAGAGSGAVPGTLHANSATLLATASEGAEGGASVTLATADDGEGMGTFTATLGDFAGAGASKELKVGVPASAYAGDYATTLTLTVAADIE